MRLFLVDFAVCSLIEHGDLDSLLFGNLDGSCISRIYVAGDPHAGINGEDALQPFGCFWAATAVVEADPFHPGRR